MEIGQEYLKASRIGQNYHLLTYQRMVSPSAIRNKTGGKRIRCRFWREHAHVEQERPEICRFLETRVSNSPTTVVTANGEVHTKEEATVYVRKLDLFVTVKLLEDTLADLSLGNL